MLCASERWELAGLSRLRKDESSIKGAGDGVFARTAIPNKTRLLRYDGEHLTRKQIMERYDLDEKEHPQRNVEAWRYVLEIPGVFIDASNPDRSNLSRFINHNRKELVNCKFSNGAVVITTRRIEAGEELFISYNKEFSAFLRSEGLPLPSVEEYAKTRQQLIEAQLQREAAVAPHTASAAAASSAHRPAPPSHWQERWEALQRSALLSFSLSSSSSSSFFSSSSPSLPTKAPGPATAEFALLTPRQP